MARTFVLATAILLALPAVLFTVGTLSAAGGDGNGLYIVKPGDTLSKIAGEKLGDFKRWREILDQNPQISDPELIFPGDTLAIPGMGKREDDAVAISTGDEVDVPTELYPPIPVTPALVEPEGDRAPVTVPTMPYVRPVPVISPNIYRAAGFISDALPEDYIISSAASKLSLVEGDEVFISFPAETGSTFTVVRPTTKVFHPQSGEFLGWVFRILGWAEVNCPGEVTSRAMLTGSLDIINVGDLVIPFDPDDVLKEDRIGEKQSTFCLTENPGGYLLASQEGKAALGEGDIVFLDQGSQSGVVPGDQFVVYRPVHPEGANVIGQLQVLKVGEKTSTALVINSMVEMSITDSVQAWDPGS